MKRNRLLPTALAALTVLLVSACGATATGTPSPDTASTDPPAAAAPAGAQQITLSVGNTMSFDPSNVTVRAGEPIQLTLQNKGQMPHDFTLGDGVTQPVKITAMGGQSASARFTIDKPGIYSFECSMPGHAFAGMRGTITAQ
jgi:uncharacterized cupredoxin-like copper-binding protein